MNYRLNKVNTENKLCFHCIDTLYKIVFSYLLKDFFDVNESCFRLKLSIQLFYTCISWNFNMNMINY